MKPDLYTKVVLSIIPVSLVVIARNQMLTPKIDVHAQAGTVGYQISSFGDASRGAAYVVSPTGAVSLCDFYAGHASCTPVGNALAVMSR
jgi:hypothetical protein